MSRKLSGTDWTDLDPPGILWVSARKLFGTDLDPRGADPVFLLKLEGVRSDLDTAQFLEVISVFPKGSKSSRVVEKISN